MIWTAKTNCALSSRKMTDRESITTTRLSTERIGWWNVMTPMPPRTASAAATKKTAIANLFGFLSFETGLHVRRQRLEQLLLGVDELLAARVRQLVFRPEHDRLHRAGVLAVPAEDAAQHVDLVGLGVPLARRDAVLLGVLGGDDEDAAHRARRGAQLAADAALEPVVVAAQVVPAAVALRPHSLVFGVHRRDHRAEGFAECRLETGEQRGDVPSDILLSLPTRWGGLAWGRWALLFVGHQLSLHRDQDDRGHDHVRHGQRQQHLPTQAHEHVVTQAWKSAAQPNV